MAPETERTTVKLDYDRTRSSLDDCTEDHGGQLLHVVKDRMPKTNADIREDHESRPQPRNRLYVRIGSQVYEWLRYCGTPGELECRGREGPAEFPLQLVEAITAGTEG